MGKRGPQPKAAPKPKPGRLPPRGAANGPKRTPNHIADPAGNSDMYIVEDILSERSVKTADGTHQKEWLVKWKDYGHKDNTWEPLSNLSGCESYIRRFNEEKQRMNEEAAKERESRKRQREAEAETHASQPSQSSAVDTSETPVGMQGKKTSVVWNAFVTYPLDAHVAICKLKKPNGDTCNTRIKMAGGTSNMRAHLSTAHAQWLVSHLADKRDTQTHFQVAEGNVEVGASWSGARRHRACRLLAYWLVRRSRPVHLVKDEEFEQFCLYLSQQKFQHTCHRRMNQHIAEMAAAGLKNNREKMADLKKDGVKPSIAADIWSDSTVSLMGTCLYYIDKDWLGLHEVLIGCTGFTGERHTGEIIKAQTALDLESVGLTFDDVHAKVSDQGSNIKKAWGGLPGGFCVAHTLELCVKIFLSAAAVAAVLVKVKGMTGYFHHSAARLEKLKEVQKRGDLPQNKPPRTGNAVRWHFSLDLMDWFRVQQRSVQMYDIENGDDARTEDTYKDSQMDHSDWLVNKQSVAILQPAARVVNDLEGTRYVTASLVLPCLYATLKKALKTDTRCPWDSSVLPDTSLTPEVREARKEYAKALSDRFLNLPGQVHRQYTIATLLDPRFCSYGFMNELERQNALQDLHAEWTVKWRGPAAPEPEPEPEPAPGQGKESLAAFLDDDDVVAAPQVAAYCDELEEYLALPAVSMDTDVIIWWRRAHTQFPRLAAMARQFLATPATSAGVERLFSKAGLTYSDLASNMSEQNLGVRLLAAYNYTPDLYTYE